MGDLKFTSFKTKVLGEEGKFQYLYVNATFKVNKSSYEGKSLWKEAFENSLDHISVLTVKDPDECFKWYMDYFLNSGGSEETSYPNYIKSYLPKEPIFKYIEKFDTFWFSMYVAHSHVTVAILEELEHFIRNGDFDLKYRTHEDSVALTHLKNLSTYWD